MMMDFEAPIDEAVHASVLRINQFMEQNILKAPEQWFWVHARWPKKAWIDAGVMD
jgi:KDO2-lipid IV(A) lauroyltransferase